MNESRIHGIGNDIIEVERIERIIQKYGNKFLDKIFTQAEQEYCSKHRDSFRHYAGRFAAKEAVIKALGIGFRRGITWVDIEIKNDANGKPHVILSQNIQAECGQLQVQVAISHCRAYATAFAICF